MQSQGGGAPDGGGGGGSRASEFLVQTPIATVCFIAICTAIQVIVFAFDVEVVDFSISPIRVLYQWQLYRLVTAAFFHGGLMHIAMNMMSLLAIGRIVERRMGTLNYVIMILWSILVSNVVYIATCWVLAFYLPFGSSGVEWLWYQSVGFSGVIFTLSVLDCAQSEQPNRSVFGFVNVPTKYYPAALLIALQVMIPEISFLGHLTGMLYGWLHTYNGTRCLMPSASALREIEARDALRSVVSKPNFVPTLEVTSGTTAELSMRHAMAGVVEGARKLFGFLSQVVYTVAYMFGISSGGGGGGGDGGSYLPVSQSDDGAAAMGGGGRRLNG